MRVGQGFPGDGAPRLELFPPGGEGADAGLGAVRHHQQLIHGEQGRQFGLISLKLLPSGPDGGVFVGRVLEFDDAQGQAVEEQYDVGSARVPVPSRRFCDSELVDRQPVVVVRMAEVNGLGLVAPDGAVSSAVLHRHAVDQHPVEGAVAGFQCGSLWLG